MSIVHLDKFDSLLIPEPAEFRSSGLVFNKKTSEVNAYGKIENWDYVYINPISNIKVTISCNPTRPYCNTSISNSKGEYFFVSHYMKYKKIDDLQILYEWLFKNLDSITPLEYLRRYIQIVGHAVATELREIIEGKRWENIPIDWKGHK